MRTTTLRWPSRVVTRTRLPKGRLSYEAAVPFIACRAALRRERPLYTRYSLRTLQVNSLFSSAKAARELGYTARPLAETVADMAAWLKAQTGAGSVPAAPVRRAKKRRTRPARSLN